MANRPMIDLMEQEYRTVRELCDELDADDWRRPTDCEGWTVQDQVSHLAGLEGLLLGRDQPHHEPPDAPHIRNDVGRLNERQVDYRRSWAPEDVLAELDDNTTERLEALRILDDEQWAADTYTVTGPATHDQALRLRIFDWYGHEQDIRRATGRPGHLDGPVAAKAAEVFYDALGFVLVKRAGATEGTTFVVEVTGSNGRVVPLIVRDGRGTVAAEVPSDPDATLTLDFEALLLRGYGRRSAEELLEAGRVELGGDTDLARRFLEGLAVTI
ncbi:MAG: maleylpyruvate isomerase family mycothiol-dependent enzyme [Actinobacteria bacterium]|nr:maleylpyruvate isomerase family mycothiol-dependent enzyme [Actinomycetota bacterium]